MPTYPANVSTVTVTGRWGPSSGATTVPTGRVTFVPNVQLKDSGTGLILVPDSVTGVLDNTGAISVVLMATDDPDLSPSGWQYTITEAVSGWPTLTYSMSFPASQPVVDLASKAPSTTPPASVTYALDTAVLHVASNLSDVANVSASRTNLGLGGAATRNVGTATGTVAAGDDARINGSGTLAGITRDALGRITAYTENGVAWTSITYDGSGRVSSYTVAGQARTISYNSSGQVTGVS